MIQAYEEEYELNPCDYRAPPSGLVLHIFIKEIKNLSTILKAHELYPTNQNILEWLSIAYAYVLKNTEKAQYYFTLSKNSNASELDLSFVRGIIELSKGNKSEADKYFSKLSFYDEIQKEIYQNTESNVMKGYSLQLKIISDLFKEINGN